MPSVPVLRTVLRFVALLFDMLGDTDAAIVHYRAAANRTTSLPEKHYLITRAARLNHRH